MSALRWTPWGLVLACMLAPATYAGIIYQDDFSGDAVDLNGATPDVGANNWVAGPSFNADGSIITAGGGGSATLSFAPVNGLVYTLDASFTGVTATDASWLALGFAAGQSMLEGTNNRFISGNVIGKAWMFHRGDANLATNNAFLGDATSLPLSNQGNRNGAAFSPTFRNRSKITPAIPIA